MKKSLVNIKRVVLSTAISCLLMSHVSRAESVGVFALFKVKNDKTQGKSIDNMEKKLSILGCSLRREGKILATKGNYDIPEVNGYFLLECESSFLQGNNNDTVMNNFKQTTENFSLVEGPVNKFGRFGLEKHGTGNSYIFKLSDYNNISPQQRNTDLSTIDRLVKKRKDRFSTEAFIRVQDAYGMKRPDEVVVIYYDSAESGDRFRKNSKNDDVLGLIVKFNKDHLKQASYVFAQSNR